MVLPVQSKHRYGRAKDTTPRLAWQLEQQFVHTLALSPAQDERMRSKQARDISSSSLKEVSTHKLSSCASQQVERRDVACAIGRRRGSSWVDIRTHLEHRDAQVCTAQSLAVNLVRLQWVRHCLQAIATKRLFASVNLPLRARRAVTLLHLITTQMR